MKSGEIGIQEALRRLGVVTQRDRNRAKANAVQCLCVAVLLGNQDEAELLAAKLVKLPKEFDERRSENQR